LLWGSSFLFREGIPAIEKQQNYRSVETLLSEGILQAVRAMVPVKSILRDFVSMDDDKGDKEEEEEEAEVEPVVKPEEVRGVIKEKKESKESKESKEEESKEESKEEESKPKNEVIVPTGPPLIKIDTGSHVGFADYNSVFDSENENGSDLLQEIPTEEEESGSLTILEENGAPLDIGDMEDLNPITAATPLAMDAADYDVLT